MTPSAFAQGRRTATRRCRNRVSDKTFTEALAEYYAANSGKVFRPKDLSEESAELFRSHDICRVILGLDTMLADETKAGTRTLLSCDVAIRNSAHYLTVNPEAKAFFRKPFI